MAFVQRDRARLTPYMNYQMGRLDSELRSAFGVRLYCTSGIRLAAEQEAIFRARYVTAGNVRGRRVYDTRVWNGVRWYRISPLGTVAVPKTSNHEIQGDDAAVDIRDTGADAGISSRTSRRGKWLRANAHRFNLVASGDGFGEGWHFTILNIFAAVPGAPATSAPGTNPTPEKSEEDELNATERRMLEEIHGVLGNIRQGWERAGDAATSARSADAKLDGLAEAVSQIVHELPGIRQTRTRAGDASTKATQILHAIATSSQFNLSAEDVAAIASSVVVQLDGRPDALAGLSDEDIARLATAAADEADRRERARLGTAPQ